MSEKVDKIVFVATFPPIQAAIKIDGQGGARFQMDVPEEYLQAFMQAAAWRLEIIKVTFELVKGGTGVNVR